MTLSLGGSGRLALALAALAVLAGCSAPVGSGPSAGAGDGTPGADDTETPAPTPTRGDRAAENRSSRPAPDSDVQGWEAGYWYDSELAIDASDGLNDSELDAVVARAMARVEEIRNVEFDEPVEVVVRDRSEIGDDVGGGGSGPGATVESIRHRALFLVGDREDGDSDPAEATRTASVQGYYDPGADRVVIVTDDERPILDEVTLAQELYHAHQFRNRPLRVPRDYTDDNLVGIRALIEGDANFVDHLYQRRCAAAWDCVRPGEDAANGSGGDSSFGEGFDVGLYLLSYVPYAEGEPLVAETYREGGWDAVDALYRDPPRSSEQVIHPNTRGDDPPEDVELPERSTGEWERITREGRPPTVTVGEGGIATMFVRTAFDDRPGGLVDPRTVLNRGPNGSLNATDPLDYDVPYATGWAGDALATYRRADGEPGYVWRIRFDSAAGADRFAEGYRSLLSYYGGADRGTHWELSGEFAGAYWLAVDGRSVTVVHGPTADSLDDLWPAANGSAAVAPTPARGDATAPRRVAAAR